MPVLIKEHFNRWYSLRSYYMAITVSDIPFQVKCYNLIVFNEDQLLIIRTYFDYFIISFDVPLNRGVKEKALVKSKIAFCSYIIFDFLMYCCFPLQLSIDNE